MQAYQIIAGLLVAICYTITMIGWGSLFISILIGHRIFQGESSSDTLLRIWLSFITGQGVWGSFLLLIALTGNLKPWVVYIVMITGCALIPVFVPLHQLWQAYRQTINFKRLIYLLPSLSYADWIGLGIILILILQGLGALLPSSVADAVHKSLVPPRAIAYTGRLEFQPFEPTYYALMPLQVEIHWAALFSITSETAVTFWDYICAISTLVGLGLLSQNLVRDKKAAIYSILMLLSTPAFLWLIGGGKPDNATTQFGIAAILWLVLTPRLGRKITWIAGCCLGWSLACRYTNIILMPAIMIFLGAILYQSSPFPTFIDTIKKIMGRWCLQFLIILVAAGITFAPMLLKNWVLVGCPLAPFWGCEGDFFTNLYHQSIASINNITLTDFILYPFTWTYARRVDTLGNISPLFIGFLPLLIIYRRSEQVINSFVVGLAGLAGFACWLLLQPFVMITRWLLIPLAFFTIPLGAAFSAAEVDLRRMPWSKYFAYSALALMVLFTLFESRRAILGVKYLASIYPRAAVYQAYPGYSTAEWLNNNRKPGERVALHVSSTPPLYLLSIPPYFLNPDILQTSETKDELQELWLHPELNTWDYYAVHGFKYILLSREYLEQLEFASPINDLENQQQLRIVFEGKDHLIIEVLKTK